MKRSKLWSGLTSTSAALLVVGLIGQNLAAANASYINTALGTTTTKVVQTGEVGDTTYFKSQFGDFDDPDAQAAAIAAALEQQLPGCIAIQCDVASRASCELAFHAVEQAMGRVDVLVCNAGIAQQKLFTDITPEEWQRMLDVNLSGAFHLCQLALPGMIRRKAGRILTVSSMWGQTGGSCEVHYSAAKAGLIGLTKALAKEEGPSGITVNCVAPGVIETDMMAAFTAEDKAALAEETPVGRLGTADEVAKLLVFLAGEDAGYITGQVFGVNGGLVI